MSNYDVVSGVGTIIDGISIKELQELIKETYYVREDCMLSEINLLDSNIDINEFEKHKSPEDTIAECLNEIANTESFAIAADDNGEKYLLFVEQSPWNYTSREKNLSKDDVIRFLKLADKAIKGFELQDLCIANLISN